MILTIASNRFKDFDIEVRRWLGDGGLEEPLHRISAFADFLSSTYVAQRLDYLRSSSVVSAIRKKIVHQIEVYCFSWNAKCLLWNHTCVLDVLLRAFPLFSILFNYNWKCLALGKNPTTKENGNFMLSENYNKDTEANLYRKSRCNTGGENREQHKTNLRKETRSRNTEELKYPRPCLDNRCGKNHYPAIENINNVQLHSRALSQSDWKCRVCSNLNVMKSPKCTLCGKLKAEKAIGIAFKNWKAEHNHCKVDRAYRKNNKHKTNSAYTVEERRTKKKNESMKREYRMFVESKLRLDDQASLHRNFADEIQSVLADIRDCNSWNIFSQKMIKAYFRQ